MSKCGIENALILQVKLVNETLREAEKKEQGRDIDKAKPCIIQNLTLGNKITKSYIFIALGPIALNKLFLTL